MAANGTSAIEALKWMRSKGAPWIKEGCEEWATRHGHPETAQWIAAQTTVLAGDIASDSDDGY
jgi:hypothetical protein